MALLVIIFIIFSVLPFLALCSSAFSGAKERLEGTSYSEENPLIADGLKIFPSKIEVNNTKFEWSQIHDIKCDAKKTIINNGMMTQYKIKLTIWFKGIADPVVINNSNDLSKRLGQAYLVILSKLGRIDMQVAKTLSAR